MSRPISPEQYEPSWQEPDEDGPDPDVCADCDHQRAFHDPCLGIDCDCGDFVEPTPIGAAA